MISIRLGSPLSGVMAVEWEVVAGAAHHICRHTAAVVRCGAQENAVVDNFVSFGYAVA